MDKIYTIQGDVLFRKIDKIPTKAKSKEGRIVVWGESTFHAHKFSDDTEVSLYTIGEAQYANLPFDGILQHEEHYPIPFEKGDYEVIRQKQYTNKDAIALVVD